MTKYSRGRSYSGVARRLVGDPQKCRRAMLFAFTVWSILYFVPSLLALPPLDDSDSNYFYLRSSPLPSPTATDKYTRIGSGTLGNQDNEQCDFYLAESAIPRGGLGVFTTLPLAKGSPTQAWPDICIYLTDAKKSKGTEIDTHTWQSYRFGAQWLGGRGQVRAACMGLVTIFNSMGMKEYASARPDAASSLVHTNGGLDRSRDPGAGAITQYYGATSVAIRDLVAGSELMLWDDGHGGDQYALDAVRNDGRSELDIELVPPPVRSLEWLQKHGMCADNIQVRTATDPTMGRGAYAKRFLSKGRVIAPVPLQIYPNRAKFLAPVDEERKIYEKRRKVKFESDQLFVNYSFQPKGSTLLLYPYGPGVGLINHASKTSEKINAVLRWSDHHMNHGKQWLDSSFSLDQFWKMQYPGSLILDVVALRDISEGEEIFIDYGTDWEAAWKEYVRNWKPFVSDKNDYVYPWDEMAHHNNPEKPYRTSQEQGENPYANNLMMVCDTRNWSGGRSEREKWRPSLHWAEQLAECSVLTRIYDKTANTHLYEVELWLNERHDAEEGSPSEYVDYDVPHSAIRFVDKPFYSDQHISTAFRHPIGFPEELTPLFWKNKKDF
eukprot:CAMPEP_0168167370 /NCGR_PEP_ID=MMETSP0139_2-20121125/2513_1 /TAXON_ID=44445 /ORGANISM="Pseudo-nitzschia australis, Strain 10249 10 AB" /LENGTH=606 /DNA_ID=CAMNT_0008084607 /DNA_START=46 /DNA_END=1866 /DNA_ORIENTATION=+